MLEIKWWGATFINFQLVGGHISFYVNLFGLCVSWWANKQWMPMFPTKCLEQRVSNKVGLVERHQPVILLLMVQKSCITWDVLNPRKLWDKLPINSFFWPSIFRWKLFWNPPTVSPSHRRGKERRPVSAKHLGPRKTVFPGWCFFPKRRIVLPNLLPFFWMENLRSTCDFMGWKSASFTSILGKILLELFVPEKFASGFVSTGLFCCT